jgi:ketosteroid isomerase-like protein
MTLKNAEIVEAGFAAYLRGDVPAMLDHFASDVVVTTRPDQPDSRDFHGHEGLVEQIAEWLETWDDFSIEIVRVREVRDVVILLAHEQGRGTRSGVPMDDEVTFVFTVKGAKVTRWRMFGSEREAIDAVGPEGETGG